MKGWNKVQRELLKIILKEGLIPFDTDYQLQKTLKANRGIIKKGREELINKNKIEVVSLKKIPSWINKRHPNTISKIPKDYKEVLIIKRKSTPGRLLRIPILHEVLSRFPEDIVDTHLGYKKLTPGEFIDQIMNTSKKIIKVIGEKKIIMFFSKWGSSRRRKNKKTI